MLRRRKDSNLRGDFSPNILAGCCLKPLGHASSLRPLSVGNYAQIFKDWVVRIKIEILQGGFDAKTCLA
jgi:hypothetical protein